METFLYIFAKTVSVIIGAVQLSMLARMLLPFFVNPEESKLYMLTAVISEPFIAPVRVIMEKLNVGQGSPIDWSFFTTYMLLSLLEMLLPVI